MKAFLILLGLLGVGVLTYFCAHHHAPAIEADLTKKTQDRLAGIGLTNVQTSAEGQIVILKGVVPDAETKARAGAQASAIWGVSEVRNELVVETKAQVEKREAVNCQEKFNALLNEPILYQTGRAVIDSKSYPLLDKLADAAKACPAAEVEVGGHTDSRGSAKLNKRLSEQRAASVVKYLAGKGLEASRFTPKGYGPDVPVADNGTEEGRQKNRRTEFKVKGI